MPLIKGKSPEAFKSNLKSEIKAGKPMKQSLAIAYSMKRKAQKMKHMAEGGEVKDYSEVPMKESAYGGHPEEIEPEEKPKEIELPHTAYLAHGGVVDRIMAKKYSQGGVVANGGDEELSLMPDSDPNNFDDLALDDHLEAHIPADFNEHGDAAEDHERADMVSRIMKSRAKKDKNPRPA